MAELWDIYDKCRQRTGKTIERGRELKNGEYHLVVHIWPLNEQGKLLIQKRQEHLAWRPGVWAVTSGSVVAGEDVYQAARRELREELGLWDREGSMEFLMEFKGHRSLCSVWLFPCDVPVNALTLQKEEVADAKWVSKAELEEMVADGSFYSYDYLNMLFQKIDQRKGKM